MWRSWTRLFCVEASTKVLLLLWRVGLLYILSLVRQWTQLFFFRVHLWEMCRAWGLVTFIQDDEAVVETWRVCLRNHTQYSRDDFCFRRRKLTKSTNSTKRKGSISPSSQLAGCCCIDIISSLSVHLLNKRKKRKKKLKNAQLEEWPTH